MATKTKEKVSWKEVSEDAVITSGPGEAVVRCSCGHGVVHLAANTEGSCPACGHVLRLRTVLEERKP